MSEKISETIPDRSQTQLQGVNLFEQQRKLWRAGFQNHKKSLRIRIAEIDYDMLLDSIVNGTAFDEMVPLPLLVDVMNDLWEADGLFE